MICFDILKDGKMKVLTLSYDDGTIHDRRLIDIMNKYKIRSTFHLNSHRLSNEYKEYVTEKEIKSLYKNHEISCHGVYHKTLTVLPTQNIIEEIFEDRKKLENLTGYPITGMSYANGLFSDNVIDTLKICGMKYARTIQNTYHYFVPDDFMKWHPTCHHNECIKYGNKFLELPVKYPLIFYVWGHSYEFDHANNWDMIEEFCSLMSDKDDIWYATNIEIYNYLTAQKNLVISADNKIVYNPSALTVWFSSDEKVYSINGGETINI